MQANPGRIPEVGGGGIISEDEPGMGVGNCNSEWYASR